MAAYPATDENPPLIITTPLRGGGPHVRLFDARDHSLYAGFFPGGTRDNKGRRLVVANIDTFGDSPEIVIVSETDSAPTAVAYELDGTALRSFRFFEPWWEGGYDVAATEGGILVASATLDETRRRTSVRWIFGLPSAFDVGPAAL